MPRTYYFDPTGQWSGGGRAFLTNADHAARRHRILASAPVGVPIIPRNIPVRGSRRSRDFLLAPQNCWPWHPAALGLREWTLVARLRAGSEYYLRRADAVLRISEALPVRQERTSPVIHNVLDEGFERALAESHGLQVERAHSRLISIGSGHSYRNLRRLLLGYQSYRDHGGRRELWVTGSKGSGAATHAVEALASSIPGVSLTWGSMTRAQCLAAIRSAAGVVLPSLAEASPLSALEAVAMTPCVVMSDIVGHRGILRPHAAMLDRAFFDPTSVTGISQALMDVDAAPATIAHAALSDPDTREQSRVSWGDRVAAWLEGLA